MPRSDQPARVLDLHLSLIRSWSAERPPRGWLRAIRDALGVTTTQMARRLGVAQSRVVALERGEVEDRLTLASLRKAAEALDCRLVYVIVPRTPLVETLEARAQAVAAAQVERTAHTMRLENQALSEVEQRYQTDRLAEKLLRGDLRRLWDEPT